MKKIEILPMTRFGKLVVLQEYGKSKNGAYRYVCLCDCGNFHVATGCNLRSGSTKSCGCIHKEFIGNLNKSHGKSSTRLNGIWRGIKDRCLNPNNSSYERYGAKGISICEEWKNSFESFYEWSMNNGYSAELTIDRIDNSKGYFPENCRWADCFTQARNKSNCRYYTYRGQTKTLSEWSEISGIDRKTISDRIDRFGWSFEKAISTKPRKNYDHRRNKTAV